MLSTTRKTIKLTKESVEGTKETTVEVDIGTNEPLDEVPERLGEVELAVNDLLVNDEKFTAMDIYQQAEYLELAYIFGPLGASQHFLRNHYLDVLVAMRDGTLNDKKAVAVQAKAERDKDKEPK